MSRVAIQQLAGGLTLYRVQLKGGSFDGQESLCTHDTVYMGGECYKRGPDDVYHYMPDPDKAHGRENWRN